MDQIYPRFARARSLFYDLPPASVATAAEAFQPSGSIFWGEWIESKDIVWSFWRHPDSTIVEQGWKIHVSATDDVAREILDTVSAYCGERRIAFKFLRDEPTLARALSKDADRGQSGKFVTIYPSTVEELRSVLEELDDAIGGLPGPYILSDLRWRDGPLHVRYGAFTPESVVSDGVQVPAIRNLDTGFLEPDVRSARFIVPSWVTTPDFIAAQLVALEVSPPDGFPTVTSALHHSNAGGVYAAQLNGANVILKEARPHTGLTPDGRNAISRLRHEETVLRLLDGTSTPVVIDSFEVLGHQFLVLERVAGIALSTASMSKHPLVHLDVRSVDFVEYRDWVLRVVARLEDALSRFHQAGYSHGDLHPNNILIGEHDEVTFVDVEMARPLTDGIQTRAFIGAPGFVAERPLHPRDGDRFALACVELFLFYPLTQMLHLGPQKAEELVTAAQETFGLSAEWVESMMTRLRPGLDAPLPSVASAKRRRSTADVLNLEAIADAIESDMTPDRQDRLWPGDPAQFSDPPFAIAHGALGVALALWSVGRSISVRAWDWIDEALDAADVVTRPGLFDGASGAAWALRLMGEHQRADQILASLTRVELGGLGADLYSGLPGLGLVMLSEQERHPLLRPIVLDVADRLRVHWSDRKHEATVPTSGGGLLRGSTGTTLFALRLFEATRDLSHLELAELTATHDMACLVQASDGSLQVNEGWRMLPYLASGSAGIGAVLAQLASHSGAPERLLATLDGTTKAAMAPFAMQAGLFAGTAGLMHYLMVLADEGVLPLAQIEAALSAQRDQLRLHALSEGPDTRFAGNGLLRASSDLATGAAGILTVLHAYQDQGRGCRTPFSGFPFLTHATSSCQESGPSLGGR